ncbi:MAG: FHA domain-containing protein [Myxococcaceae bacterium]
MCAPWVLGTPGNDQAGGVSLASIPMPQTLSQLALAYWANPDGLRGSYACPFLKWETSHRAHNEALWLGTQTGGPWPAIRSGDPVIFPLRKGPSTTNAFAMGVTLGRTENNDVAIDDQSVSRFHAYFQHDEKTNTWKLSDAESKNGTFIGDKRLVANLATPLLEGTRLLVGDIRLVFLSREALFRELAAMSRGQSGSPSLSR